MHSSILITFTPYPAELEADADKTTHSTSTTSHNIIQANLESKLTEIFAPTSSGTATPAHPLPNHSHVAHAPPSSLASQLNAQLLNAAAAKDAAATAGTSSSSSSATNGQSASAQQQQSLPPPSQSQQQSLASAPATIAHQSQASPSELAGGSKSRPGSFGEDDMASTLVLLKHSSPPSTPGRRHQSASPTAELGAGTAVSSTNNSATSAVTTYASAAAAAISSSLEPEVTASSGGAEAAAVSSSTHSEQSAQSSVQLLASKSTAPKSTMVSTTVAASSVSPSNFAPLGVSSAALGRRPSRFSVTPVAEPASTALHQIAGQVTAETLTTPTTTTTNSFPESNSTGSAPSSSSASASIPKDTLPKVVSSAAELKPAQPMPSIAPTQSLKLSRFTVTPCTSLTTIGGGEVLSAEQIALNSSILKDSYSQTSPILLKVNSTCLVFLLMA